MSNGLKTGFTDLNEIITEYKKHKLLIIAGNTSISKTSLAVDIVKHFALNEKISVHFLSMGMPAEQITRRMLCSMAEISEMDFDDKSFEENEFNSKWSRITKAATEISKASLYIDPTPVLNIIELRSRALKLKAENNIDVVVIDYLQSIQPDPNKPESKSDSSSNISNELECLAKEVGVPVIVIGYLDK